MKMTADTVLITGVPRVSVSDQLVDRITAEHPGIEAIVLDVTDPVSITRAAEAVRAGRPELNVPVGHRAGGEPLRCGPSAGRRGPRRRQPARSV
ncbi:hypothetical protein ACWEOA_05270 [Streptomyces sp. NPDC004457]